MELSKRFLFLFLLGLAMVVSACAYMTVEDRETVVIGQEESAPAPEQTRLPE